MVNTSFFIYIRTTMPTPLIAARLLKMSFPIAKQGAKSVKILPGTKIQVVNKPWHKLHNCKMLKCQAVSYKVGDQVKKVKPVKHLVTVTALEQDTPLSESPVLVSCSCEYFAFTCEVALKKKGNARIQYSNGDMPEVTNPRLRPSVCKHLYKVLMEVHKRGL